MKLLRIFSVLLVFCFLGGCASNQYAITYSSEPVGATVICNGINQGYTPTTLYYELNEENKKRGTMQTVPCTAVWSSGAKRDFSNTWDLNKFPNGVMQTLPRPNVDGYSQDAEFALKVRQMKAAENAAYQQQRAASAAEDAAAAANRRNNKITNCYTIGGITTCY